MDLEKEIRVLKCLLNESQHDLAKNLNVSYDTINSLEDNYDLNTIEKLYSYAYKKEIYINNIFENFLMEEFNKESSKVLFHGTKNGITFPLDLNHSRNNNDFGKGFYLGENLNQAATYISLCDSHEIFSFCINLKDLKILKFGVELDWMIAISYYRGWLFEYKDNSYLKKIISDIESFDVIIAPIADNRMFDVIAEFVKGEITTSQCIHALSATDLGYQYVIRTNKGLKSLKYIKTLYLSNIEKEDYIKKRKDIFDMNLNKVKASRIKYKNEGKYITEVLQCEN
jgi:DNA-binding XRE family transcriptional regulator